MNVTTAPSGGRKLFDFGFGQTVQAATGPVDPLAGITFTRRFQTTRGEIQSVETNYTVTSAPDSSANGTYWPTGEEQFGQPIYATDDGINFLRFNGSENHWELVGDFGIYNNSDPSSPTGAGWPGTLAVNAGEFNILVPIGLYQDIARTIPATATGDPVASFFETLRSGGTAAEQSNSSQQPILLPSHGVPYISNDGVDDVLINSIGTLNGVTFAIVGRVNNAAINTGVVCLADGSSNDYETPGALFWNNANETADDAGVDVRWNGGLTPSESFTIVVDVPILITGTITHPSLLSVKVWQNGVLKLDVVSASVLENDVTLMAFGARLAGGSPSNYSLSDIGAVLITPDTTTPTRELIETALIDLYQL